MRRDQKVRRVVHAKPVGRNDEVTKLVAQGVLTLHLLGNGHDDVVMWVAHEGSTTEPKPDSTGTRQLSPLAGK